MTQRPVKACQVPPPSEVEPSLPKAFDAVVLKSLAKDVKDRYADAGAFRSALEDFAFKNNIPASNSFLVDFMQALYAERIAKEDDPRSLEEDSGLTDLDARGLPKNAQSPTIVDRNRQGGQVFPSGQSSSHLTEAVGQKPKSRAGLWLGLGVVGVLVIGIAGFALKGRGTTETPKPPDVVTTPVEPPIKKVELPTVVEFLTFSLTSEPTGAEVELGGDKKGLTPLEVKLEKAKLPTLLKVSRDGYESFQTTLADSTDPNVVVTLKKRVAVKVGPKPSDIKTTRQPFLSFFS